MYTKITQCAKHTKLMRSMSLLGGSGGMPPQEIFENIMQFHEILVL